MGSLPLPNLWRGECRWVVMARAGAELVLLPAQPLEVTALTSWVSVWAEPTQGSPWSDSESESSGQCWGNAHDGCPLLLCSQCRLPHLLFQLVHCPPPSPLDWGLMRAVHWDDTSLGHLLHETACSPSLSDLWTLENHKQPSAHPNCSLTPSPLGPPSLASHRAIPRA